jgi:N-acetylneuraminic acid mutarotase
MTTKAFRRVAVLFAAVALVVAGCATAVVLPDGRVYILAGTAKIYDPASGTISIAPSPTIPSFWSTTTLLQDGKVLIAGGIGGDPTSGQSGATSADAQLFDPATGTYSDTGSMNEARALHTATLLQDGKVLVTGGGTPNMSGPTLSGTGESPAPTPPPLNSAELYDPATGTWTETGTMEAGLAFHTANLLQDGRVLVVGAEQTSDTSGRMVAQLYDPSSGTFTSTGTPSELRALQTATTLSDGRVLIVGGVTSASGDQAGQAPPIATAEVYDPAAGTWSPAGSMSTGRVYHGASILDDGRVLVVGGLDPAAGSSGLTSAEIYDPASNSWSPTGNLATAMIAPVASLLQDGTVLVVGIGDTSSMGSQTSSIDFINAGEIYDPASGTFSPVEVEIAAGSPAPGESPAAAPSAS